MSGDTDESAQVEELLETPRLADALESERFKQFLDHVPFAVAVSELNPSERLTYANLEFERLTGTSVASFEGRPWNALPVKVAAIDGGEELGSAVMSSEDYLGTFLVGEESSAVVVDAWSSIIENEKGVALFRLVALARTDCRSGRQEETLPGRSRKRICSCASCSTGSRTTCK